MDFTLTDEQQAIADLAHRILSEQLPPERLRELEQTDAWFADDVWAELGKADLLGIALPEADGGGGYGILEACLIAEQVGRTVAPVPYLSSIVGVGDARRPASAARRSAKQLLPDVIAGAATLTVALYEPTDVAVPAVPTTQATADGDGWRLDGEKSLVVGADRAAAILVPARTSRVRPRRCSSWPRAPTACTSRARRPVSGEPQWTVRLDGVARRRATRSSATPHQGAEIVAWTSDRLTAAVCATQTGVCEEALAITARYVSEREQFGSKLGTFQAVGQRVADAYIDTEAIRLTALQATWRLSEGLDAHDELMTAKFWAAEGAQRVVHAAQHLHGGIGIDLDYPIHRYFRWAKVLELTLGGASPSLLRLGASLATQPVGGG